MKTAFRLLVFGLCLSVCPVAAYGQGNCTMQNIAGTYAFTFTGASAIVGGVAPDMLHWEALYGPIAGLGVLTITPEGIADGHYWLVAGARNLGLTPIPLHSRVTLNAGCTGQFESDSGGSPLVEQFVVLGNGREIRAVATTTAVPTGNWLTTAHRIGGSCGQHKMHGDYLFECKNLFPLPVPAPNIFGGAIQIRMKIAPDGDYTATVYGKVGPSSVPFPAFGYVRVNDDCTAEGTLESPALPTVSHAKGVFFDEGKRGYWLPLAQELPDGSRFPQPYGYCLITQIDNK